MLHGRQVERARVDALLDGARTSRSGVLVVRGEAGMGKSALLDHAVAHAGDLRVLRATGVESESELPFAGLHQLLRPVLGLSDRLPAAQAAAIAAAFGIGDGAGDRFLISLAALGLLAEAASENGVLAVVDDAQWLDGPSAEALVFAGRRLEAEGVALLLAARDGDARKLAAPGLEALRLDGLGPEDAAALLAERAGPHLAAPVRDRLVVLAHGHPLALAELPALLTPGQLAGREPLAEPVPVGRRVEEAFLGRIEQLDAPARDLLLVVAADDSGELAPILRAAAALGVPRAALDGLEASGLVRVDGATVAFRHPLVRSAVLGRATFRRREAVHRALAAALPEPADADRRAWHLAVAAHDPDPSVADELERAAERARRRGGHAAAATAFERAAQLTSDEAVRARRLVDAADAHWTAGRVQRAGALLAQAHDPPADPALRARAALLRGSYELERGRALAARDVLVDAADEAAATAPAAALELLVRAAEVALVFGHGEWLPAFAERAAGLPEPQTAHERFLSAVLQGVAPAAAFDFDAAVPWLTAAARVADDLDDPRTQLTATVCDLLLGDFATVNARRERVVDQLRAAGAVGGLPLALEFLAASEHLVGRFGAAAANAAEGLRLAGDTGQETHLAFLLATTARIEAVQGRDAECEAHATEAIELAVARGLRAPGAMALLALGTLDLARGRADEALGRLTAIAEPSSGMAHGTSALISAPDLAEAAVRAGRPELAAATHERFAAWAERVPGSWPTAAAARVRGLLASGEAAEAAFEEALRAHARAELPFEEARTRLLLGEHLRRARRRVEAREQLRAALAIFERLGAKLWAERAAGELRATGETARRRTPDTIDQLTPQELQIARFVSEGATNRDVASRLFLSPRTVEYHLHKVFTKLGIASRAELARVVPGNGHEAAPPRAASVQPA